MRKLFQTSGLITVLVAILSSTSCVTTHPKNSVTLEKASKIPPFDATLEKIDFFYRFVQPFKLATEVDLYTKETNSDFQMTFSFFPADQSVVNFAHTLHEGQHYSFPQVFKDYLNSHPTNSIAH